jgi:rhodanese-related sulfurtransferase
MPYKTLDELIEDALKAGVEEVFPWDLEEWIEEGRDMLLLDVREPCGYDAMRIKGSINVPRGTLEMACEYNYDATVPELVDARERIVIVICRSGKRSVLAAKTMHEMGYQKLYSLKLGVKGWNDADLPLYDQHGERVDGDVAAEFLEPPLLPEQIRAA